MKNMILALMARATLVVFDAQAHRRGKEETAHAVVVATLISEVIKERAARRSYGAWLASCRGGPMRIRPRSAAGWVRMAAGGA